METTPAGFWRRLAAWIIDGLILIIPMMVISSLFMPHTLAGSGKMLWFGIITNLSYLLINVAYYVGFLSSNWQATPGKRLMKVYIVHAGDFRRLSRDQALRRFVIFYLPTLLFMLVTPFMMTAIPMPSGLAPENQQRFEDIQKKAWHKEALTPEDQVFMNDMALPRSLPGLSPEDQQRYAEIRDKMVHNQKLTPEENEFMVTIFKHQMFSGFGLAFQVINFLNMFYFLAIATTVAWTRQKIGLHDKFAHTRALRGRIAMEAMA